MSAEQTRFDVIETTHPDGRAEGKGFIFRRSACPRCFDGGHPQCIDGLECGV